jgi:hypothetical protein
MDCPLPRAMAAQRARWLEYFQGCSKTTSFGESSESSLDCTALTFRMCEVNSDLKWTVEQPNRLARSPLEARRKPALPEAGSRVVTAPSIPRNSFDPVQAANERPTNADRPAKMHQTAPR